MKTALIGYTGFVGTNLLSQAPFDDLYNSKNIQDIRGKDYDLIVSAGNSSLKWIANKNPDEDLASIEKLEKMLETVKAKNFVLISTIDVYDNPVGIDEDAPINDRQPSVYGKHRRLFEIFCASHFNCFILRLPILFGNGLKKNIVYDFMNDNCLDMVHQDGILQFYDVGRLWQDIKKILDLKINIINVATEPLSVKELAKQIFDIDFSNDLKTLGCGRNRRLTL